MLRLLSVVSLCLLMQSAQAEEAGVLRRLKTEPVTLFDWGMAQLDRDIARAAKTALRTSPPTTGDPQTGVIYDWRTERINIYVSLVAPNADRTEAVCRTTFSEIVAALTHTAPQGPDAAGWYLLNAFKPQGHFWGSRFEDLGTKLLAVVRLEVSFVPASFESLSGDPARVRCSGRLDARPSEIVVELAGRS